MGPSRTGIDRRGQAMSERARTNQTRNAGKEIRQDLTADYADDTDL